METMVETRAPAAGTELAWAVKRQIHLRTWGRVRHLQVELRADRVVVHGTTPTYYTAQLAIKAIQEVLGTSPVELDLEVEPRKVPPAWS
jgi:hypothetical protein